MIRNELVGISILTYNRPNMSFDLISNVLRNKSIDFIVAVKDKYIDYGNLSPANFLDDRYEFVQIDGIHNIAYNKNIGIKKLLDKGCQHIFMLEDDIIIKDDKVFQTYIDTAKSFNLGHMNWNTIPEVSHNPTYTISNGECELDITFRVCGCFSYFSREALIQCGLLDEVNYWNAFEHADHAYRMSIQKFTTPFYAFADIHNASSMLSNVGEGASTIDHESQQYRENVIKSAQSFANIYGRPINQIYIPSVEQVKTFLSSIKK